MTANSTVSEVHLPPISLKNIGTNSCGLVAETDNKIDKSNLKSFDVVAFSIIVVVPFRACITHCLTF